jgi:hypothetical protein
MKLNWYSKLLVLYSNIGTNCKMTCNAVASNTSELVATTKIFIAHAPVYERYL